MAPLGLALFAATLPRPAAGAPRGVDPVRPFLAQDPDDGGDRSPLQPPLRS